MLMCKSKYNQSILKVPLSFLAKSQASLVISSLKNFFKASRDFLVTTDTIWLLSSKCRPNYTFGYPEILTATGLSFVVAVVTLFLSFSIDSTTPILRQSFSGIQRGVPTLRIPAVMLTPKMIGALALKTFSLIASKAHGNTAAEPPLSFLELTHSVTYSVNLSNKL